MQATNIKLGIGTYAVLILLLAVFAMLFLRDPIFQYIVDTTGDSQIQDSQQATKDTTDLLLSLDKIKLDTSVLQSSYLQSLTPFPNFPIDANTINNFGKVNPFIGTFSVIPDQATSSVGAVVYTNQRSTNGGKSVRAVAPNRTTGPTRR